jgi:hypothetical protein
MGGRRRKLVRRRDKARRVRLTPEVRRWIDETSLYVTREPSADGSDRNRRRRKSDLG